MPLEQEYRPSTGEIKTTDTIEIPRVVLSRKDIGPAAKLCYGVIASYAGAFFRPDDLNSHLAAELGFNAALIQVAVSELRVAGLLEAD